MTEPRAPHEGVVEPMVLVVDDDPTVLQALSSLLGPRLEPLYRVETAASAEEALEVVAGRAATGTGTAGREACGGLGAHPVALVISDERMPGRSGTDLLVALRQHPAHRHGGRIIVTAYAGLASAKKAINEAEVDRYYPKPWDAEGGLLPAVASILGRFGRGSGLDRFLVASVLTDPPGIAAVRAVRRAWWEYLTLLGESPEDEAEVPSFDEPEDKGAVHFLARRFSPREEQHAGTVRLRPGPAPGGAWLLDRLAFLPEEAGDPLETLLLRTAVLHAASEGISVLKTEAPLLRREVYEALAFKPAAGGDEGKARGTVLMEIHPRQAGREEAHPHAKRFRLERRLCLCDQTGCPARDYAAPRRSYFCPLDLHEGRLPAGFPREKA